MKKVAVNSQNANEKSFVFPFYSQKVKRRLTEGQKWWFSAVVAAAAALKLNSGDKTKKKQKRKRVRRKPQNKRRTEI